MGMRGIGLTTVLVALMSSGCGGSSGAASTGKPNEVDIIGTGRTVAIKQALFCGADTDALDEIAKWSARGDAEEVTRTLLRTGSDFVPSGEQVKVLDLGVLSTRVRVLSKGRECFVSTELLREQKGR